MGTAPRAAGSAANTTIKSSQHQHTPPGTTPAEGAVPFPAAPARLYSRVRPEVTVIMPRSVQDVMRAPLSGMVILSLVSGEVFSFNPEVVRRLARQLDAEPPKAQSWWRAVLGRARG